MDEVHLYFQAQSDRVVINSSDDVNVRIHENALYLLLTNLLSNALKYSPIDTPVVMSIQANFSDLIIDCTDYGIGITPKQRSKIYDSYVRLPQSNVAVSGLGLGLTIVKAITNTYNGSITISENKPDGTKFIVVLRNVITDV